MQVYHNGFHQVYLGIQPVHLLIQYLILIKVGGGVGDGDVCTNGRVDIMLKSNDTLQSLLNGNPGPEDEDHEESKVGENLNNANCTCTPVQIVKKYLKNKYLCI